MNDLIVWINSELSKRAWSNNELARRSGMSSAGMSLVMTGRNAVTWEFCANVARALGEPPEKLFRLAGLLPQLPLPERDPALQELFDIAKKLSATDREELLAYAKLRYRRAQEKD